MAVEPISNFQIVALLNFTAGCGAVSARRLGVPESTMRALVRRAMVQSFAKNGITRYRIIKFGKKYQLYIRRQIVNGAINVVENNGRVVSIERVSPIWRAQGDYPADVAKRDGGSPRLDSSRRHPF